MSFTKHPFMKSQFERASGHCVQDGLAGLPWGSSGSDLVTPLMGPGSVPGWGIKILHAV